MGLGKGRLKRVGSDLISDTWRRALEPALGALRGDLVLAEVALESLPPRAKGSWQNGMVFSGEVVLREQRIITLIFKPLEKILGP